MAKFLIFILLISFNLFSAEIEVPVESFANEHESMKGSGKKRYELYLPSKYSKEDGWYINSISVVFGTDFEAKLEITDNEWYQGDFVNASLLISDRELNKLKVKAAYHQAKTKDSSGGICCYYEEYSLKSLLLAKKAKEDEIEIIDVSCTKGAYNKPIKRD